MTHVSVDKARDGSNLLRDEPYASHLKSAHEHKWDAYNSGTMCASFSAVRHRPGGPPPVRNAENIYGLSTNSPAQQKEADEGTKLACRSVEIADAILDSAKQRNVDGGCNG